MRTYRCQSSHWGNEIIKVKATSPDEAAQTLAEMLESEVGDDSYDDVITVSYGNKIVAKYTAQVERTVLVEEITDYDI
jgi:hypothetical protein